MGLGVDLDKPLLGGTENHGIVAAPTMRIAVLVLVIGKERAAIGEQPYDNWNRAEDILTFIFWQALEVTAAIIERCINLQAVFLTGIEVVGAAAGFGVHDAAALSDSDVIGQDTGKLNRKEGVLKFNAGKVRAFELGAHASFFYAAFGLQGGDAISGEKQRAFFGVDHGVFEIRMKCQRAIVGNGPGGSGPDNGTYIAADFRCFPGTSAYHSKFHPDGGAGVVFVLDFGFGERGRIDEAPINGFASAIDVAAFHEVEKGAGNGGFVIEAHG